MQPTERSLKLKLKERYGETAGNHGLNSAEYMAKVRQQPNEAFTKLEHLWLSQFNGLPTHPITESLHTRTDSNFDLIDSIRFWMSRDLMPPPECLIALNQCFEMIEQYGEQFTLNQLILGPARLGQKSRSRLGPENALLRLLATLLELEEKQEQPRSQSKVIEQFCSDRELDPDRIRQQLTRWRRNSIHRDISPTSRRIRLRRSLEKSKSK
jgi:hypothetical protein